MEAITLSPKYQIVIPREIRESLKLRPGEKMQVFEVDGRIEVVRVRPVKSLRGRFKGIDTTVRRDADRI
jgi:AbrB family looped-hinge helix DNA binding protein